MELIATNTPGYIICHADVELAYILHMRNAGRYQTHSWGVETGNGATNSLDGLAQTHPKLVGFV